MKILHIISGLGMGGAEKNLFEIVSNDKKNTNIIISLSKHDYFYIKLKNRIKIKFVNFKKKNIITGFIEVVIFLIKEKPDVIMSWMYHANFLTIPIFFLTFHKNIIWNFRHSILIGNEKNLVIYEKFLVFFSKFIPKKIVFNSYKSLNHFKKLGISKKKIFSYPKWFYN